MLIDFPGKVAAVRSDIIVGAAVIKIKSKLADVDEDHRDNLAELCRLSLSASLAIPSPSRHTVELDCLVESISGNFADATMSTSFRINKKDLTLEYEQILTELCRLEIPVIIEVSGRQMSFDSMKEVKVELKSFRRD